MGFEQLIARVQQAEQALEVQERRVGTDLQRFKQTWRAAWTPGRIVIAGLAAGFVVGRAEPLRSLGKGGSLMQLLSLLPGLFAGITPPAATEEATAAGTEPPAGPAHPDTDAETLARAEATLQAARAAVVETSEP